MAARIVVDPKHFSSSTVSIPSKSDIHRAHEDVKAREDLVAKKHGGLVFIPLIPNSNPCTTGAVVSS